MDARLEYYIVFTWMSDDLGLKGNDLHIYALIAGFSRSGQGCFHGSLQYISKVCGCTIRTAQNTLKDLVNKGLIHKREIWENGVKMCQYSIVPQGMEKIAGVWKNFPEGMEKFSGEGMEKIAINNTTPYSDNKKHKEKPTLSLPFSSQKFIDTWNALCEEKEWKKKTRNALQLALNKLAKYHEDFAIELIEKTIAGGWKGVVFDDTDAKYQEWKSARQQKIDNAVPRQSVQNKPRQLPADNNVDAMYAKLRAKREAEERELREQLQAQYGDTYRPSGGQDDR